MEVGNPGGNRFSRKKRLLGPWSMIRKSVQRFSEKIVLKQRAKARDDSTDLIAL
jgi:hypothetical protein